MRQLDSLTGLRAALALWVLFRHWFYFYPAPYGQYIDIGFSSAIFNAGYLGVDGFFILSGFILAYRYSSAHNYSHREFLVARLARVYPVHLVCLSLVLLAVLGKQIAGVEKLLGTEGHSWGEFVGQLLLLDAWRVFPKTVWNDVAWSVSAEWFAYCFFPVFVHVSGRLRRISGNVISVLVLLAAIYLIEIANGQDRLSIAGSLSRIGPEFLLGVTLQRSFGMPASSRPRIRGVLSLAVIAIGIALKIDTVAVGGLALLIVSLTDEGDFLSPIFSGRICVYLGGLSYSLYLVQRLPQGLWSTLRREFLFINGAAAIVQVGLLLSVSILSAALLFHFIEQPMRIRVRRLLSSSVRLSDSKSEVSERANGAAPTFAD